MARYTHRRRSLHILFTLPLAAACALFLRQGALPGSALALSPMPDTEHAAFGRCAGRHGYSCVIDGDSLRYRGEQIRIADINAPEMGHPQCERGDRDADRYGRSLRVITRGGRSLGAQMVDEGLAEAWQGHRGFWC